MHTLGSECGTPQAAPAASVSVSEPQDSAEDSPTKGFLDRKETPDPKYNRHAFLDLVDGLFREQKYVEAGRLWRRIGYEPLTQLSLERNNELLRILVKLRDRNLSKNQKQMEAVVVKAPAIRVEASQDLEDYLVRNDSVIASQQGLPEDVKAKLEEYEKLRKEKEEASGGLEKVLAAKLENREGELHELLGARLSSRDSVVVASPREDSQAEQKNLAIIDTIFGNLSQMTDELTKGRTLLQIPDVGSQESLIRRTSTASEMAKKGSTKLNTQNLLRELFSVTGELERLTSEFVLHLQLGLSRKRAAEAMSPSPSPTPSRDMFGSPASKSSTARTTLSPDKRRPETERYTGWILGTKDKGRVAYQDFLEADLKGGPELQRKSKAAFFELYGHFGTLHKHAEGVLLELAMTQQRLAMQEDAARSAAEVSAKLREAEMELSNWREGTTDATGTREIVEKDFLEKRVKLLERRAEAVGKENSRLEEKVALGAEQLREKTATSKRLEKVVSLKDEKLRNLEALVVELKREIRDQKEIEDEIARRVKTRGGRAENDLKRIVEVERERNKLRRDLERLNLEMKELLLENQELKLHNAELSESRTSHHPASQIVNTHTSVLEHIPETSSVSGVGGESLANTTEVLRLSGSFINSARRDSEVPNSPPRNSTFKTIRTRGRVASPSFTDEPVDVAAMQQKYEKTIRMLQEAVHEHKKVLREERTQAAMEKEGLQEQLYNALGQLGDKPQS